MPELLAAFCRIILGRKASIVDWINLKHEAVKPIPISGPEIKTIDLESAKLERQISEIAALLRQTTSANRKLSLITILLAILLSGGTWYAVNRRIDSVSADVEQISKKLDRAIDNFGKAIVELEDKTAGQNQSDANGSVQKAESQPENPDSKPKSVSKNGSEKSKPDARATDQSAARNHPATGP